MRIIMRALGVTAALGCGTALLAQAQSRVHFQPGADHADINGTISGKEYVDYMLGARKGQTMHAALKVVGTNGDGTAYFNILPPGSTGEAIFVGSMDEDGKAAVTLPASGDYAIRVYLMGNDASAGKTVGYTIRVSIK